MPKVAIIGAGPTGLTAGVSMMLEGVNFTLFEKSKRIGGVWGPDDCELPEQGVAWPTMQVNISRHTGTFSNYPWPESSHDFPTTQEVYHYLCRYAEHFNLLPHIKMGCHVIEVLCQEDKKWLVRWQENKTTIKEEIFDSVIVASSKFTNPHIPDFKGVEKLNGKFCHSAHYRSAKDFGKKIILVVGGSLSGTSIAEELAKNEEVVEVIHLIRKPRWIIKRYRSSNPQNDGPLLPRDLLKTYNNAQKPLSPKEQYELMLQHCPKQNSCAEWQMFPDTPPGFVVADDYWEPVHSGKLKPLRGDIAYFSDSSVILTDGRTVKFDAVIFCTGYQSPNDLPFFSYELRQKATAPLYEDTFPLDTHGLAICGRYPGPRGAAFPLVELQGRFAAAVFSGRLKLPLLDAMKEQIASTPTNRDDIAFSSAIAQKLGIIPDFNSLSMGLRHMLLNGPYTPARFRLAGPHNEPELAIKTIESTASYRSRLLHSKDKIPSLASLCMFKRQHTQQKDDEKSVLPSGLVKNV